jgi:protein-L-isoaspartate(D-aspartate) O-methyltransferase
VNLNIRDTYKHKGLRKRLVEKLFERGINDARVLGAIGRVPRHVFFDSAFTEQAYEDKAFPIGSGQTISQPYTVAYQSELLEVKPGHKVLEIGTGSGYQACVLAEMGAVVYSIERIQELHEKAETILKALNKDVKLRCGDGSAGWPEEAPFDAWAEFLEQAGVPEEQRLIASALVDPEGRRPRIFFQKVPEPKTAKNRVHLDLRAAPGLEGEERMATLEAECDRLVALGATRFERYEPAPPMSAGHIVMADPEGNEFCLD